jgi:N-acetylglucosaminyldiphosphoundecaprenol N-acetyl-beta-D-mannosaminyltransferase
MTNRHASPQRRLLFGLLVDAVRLEEVVSHCREAIETRRRLLIGVINAAKVVNLRRDAALRDSLLVCDLVLADGQSVVWASKLLGRPLPERVTGIDLFEALLALAERDQLSVYLLGAQAEVLASLVARLEQRFPRLRIAGARDGYFTAEESAEVAEDIRATEADMLFLGMVSPKKEIFLSTYGENLNVPVLHGVGGSFDVLAGLTRRAPESWQRFGMEWAYRLKQEPSRLWRRYARTNVAFVLLVMSERLRPSRPWRRSAEDQETTRPSHSGGVHG